LPKPLLSHVGTISILFWHGLHVIRYEVIKIINRIFILQTFTFWTMVYLRCNDYGNSNSLNTSAGIMSVPEVYVCPAIFDIVLWPRVCVVPYLKSLFCLCVINRNQI